MIGRDKMFKWLKKLFSRKTVIITDDGSKVVIGDGCQLVNITVGNTRISTDEIDPLVNPASSLDLRLALS